MSNALKRSLEKMRTDAEAYAATVKDDPIAQEPKYVPITYSGNMLGKEDIATAWIKDMLGDERFLKRVRTLTLYERYLFAWEDYLKHIDDPKFADRIEQWCGPFFHEHKVLRWPKTWPEADLLFGGRDSFTSAIEYAMRGQS